MGLLMGLAGIGLLAAGRALDGLAPPPGARWTLLPSLLRSQPAGPHV